MRANKQVVYALICASMCLAVGLYSCIGSTIRHEREISVDAEAEKVLKAEIGDREAFYVTASHSDKEMGENTFSCAVKAVCEVLDGEAKKKVTLDGTWYWRKVHDPLMFGIYEMPTKDNFVDFVYVVEGL